MLFSCSIRENIAYGAVDPDAVSAEDIYRAARVANAYNFIQTFPKGFDTVVGEKGVLLSGGTLPPQPGPVLTSLLLKVTDSRLYFLFQAVRSRG